MLKIFGGRLRTELLWLRIGKKADCFNPYPVNVENASRWQMGFNSAFKGLNKLQVFSDSLKGCEINDCIFTKKFVVGI